jgi:hypothetical protein
VQLSEIAKEDTMETKRSVPQWESEVAQLRVKAASNLTEVEGLREKKRALALEAALGGEEAKKQLDHINAALTTAAFEADDLATAIGQAEAELKAAQLREQQWLERLKMEEVAERVPQVLAVAKGYSDKLYGAAADAREVTRLVDELRELVPDSTTKQSLDRLLRGVAQNPFELCAIHSGLKAFISLRGEPAHSDRNVRLEENLAGALNSVVGQARRYAEIPAEDRKLAAALERDWQQQQAQQRR